MEEPGTRRHRSVMDPTAEPVTELHPEPVAEVAAGPVAEPTVGATAETAPEPTIAATDQSAADAAEEPVVPGESFDLPGFLRRRFGHPGFRPGQETLIRAALSGRDALGVLPTGGGKTLCFQMPALLLEGTVLVVSPLISLMEEQVERAREAGCRAALLNSTQGPSESERVRRDATGGRLDLLFLAPERFSIRSFREVLESVPVALLAVDEAHCISEWGHDFRPEYSTLGAVRADLGVPVLALTATATPRVRAEIVSSLGLADPVRVTLSFDRPNLGWQVVPAGGHAGRVRMLDRFLRSRDGGAAIVYAATRRSVEAVRRDLSRRGHPIRAYHAGLPPALRSRIQDRFLAEDRPVIVATNAFGMGIDKPDVRLVLHYQLPGSLEAYYQEGGRAGRDGEEARCIGLSRERDFLLHRRFLETTHPPTRVLRRLRRHLLGLVGPGGKGSVELGAVARGLERGGAVLRRVRTAGAREAVAALRALERSGSIRVYRCPEPGDDEVEGEGPRRAVVGVHSGPLDTTLPETLRRRGLERIRAVEGFAASRGCRRARILQYFGETGGPGRCSFCDRCAPHLFSPSALR